MREIAAHLAVSAYLEDWHSYAIARPPRHPSWEAHQGLARPSLTLGPYARAREATPKGRGARGGRRPGSQIPPPLFNLQSPSIIQPIVTIKIHLQKALSPVTISVFHITIQSPGPNTLGSQGLYDHTCRPPGPTHPPFHVPALRPSAHLS